MLFDTVKGYYDELVRLSLAGEFPSIENRVCKYRDYSGRKCVVGVLIPDSEYEKSIEGQSVHDPIVNELIGNRPLELTLDKLADIQSLHDVLSRRKWNHDKFVSDLHNILFVKKYD